MRLLTNFALCVGVFFVRSVTALCFPRLVFVLSFQQGKASSGGKSSYSLASLPRAASGAVGLKNLGCICYMNASVQNLFMVSGFRNGVLGYVCEDEDKKVCAMHVRLFAALFCVCCLCYLPCMERRVRVSLSVCLSAELLQGVLFVCLFVLLLHSTR